MAVESNFSDDPMVSILFFGICMMIGVTARHLLQGSKVPYTVALLVIGVAIGCLEYGTSNGLGKFGDGIRLWANINADLFLAVFLPALLFESAFSMDPHYIKKCMTQMILLAGPGVLVSTFLLGAAVKLTFPYGWNWKTSLLLGGLLTATDPVAVVALLKDLGGGKKLSTLIEGESLLNDGMAMVVYQLFFQMVLGQSFSAGAIIKYLVQASVGSVGIGLAFGIATLFLLRFIFNDTVVEITLTLAVSYIAYFMAQGGADASGILTVTTLGMFYAIVARTISKGAAQQSLHHFWEMVAYVANTLIFILSGIIIAEGVLSSKYFFEDHETLWAYVALLYVFVQVSRAIVVCLLYPGLRYYGYGLDWKEAIILAWSGLRGPVSLALALSVKSTSNSSLVLSQTTGTLFVFMTGWIVFLTLVVNGSTAQFILHILHMDNISEDKLSKTKRRILDYTRKEMMNKALDAFGDMGDDEELGPSDWPTVKRYLDCLDNLQVQRVHSHAVSQSEKLDAMDIRNIRIHLLKGVEAAYWGMLEEGRISQTAADILIKSIDEAVDLVSFEALCDWNGLKAHVQFPSYYKFLKMRICPAVLVSYFMVERLEQGCYLSAAFLRAHRIARMQLHDLLGNNEITYSVINESKAEENEAKKFLEDAHLMFPQVFRVLKTRQMAYAILQQLSDYLHNFEKIGLFEEKEIIHLQETMQCNMKKLLKKSTLVKMPKFTDLLRGHPFFGALPSMMREPLEDSTHEIMELKGKVIYREGSDPKGIWLISNGIVKWTSTSLKNNRSLHPIFSHGSSLGLYEVLVGKPYICNMITDSTVQCFFIGAEKILSLLRSDPAVENFFWQESAIVIAKLLFPQVYEKMSMQELRYLIAERTMMKVYTREETIGMASRSVGFLLEGVVKSQEFPEELIPSPAVLLPLCIDSKFFNLETSGAKEASFYHQGSGYLVETTARIIVFNMEALENDGADCKQSASWTSRAVEVAQGQNKEHGAQLNRPKHLYVPRRSRMNLDEANQQTNSLAARALQLSVFGCMVSEIPRSSMGETAIEALIPSTLQEAAIAGDSLGPYTRIGRNSNDYNDVLVRIDS